VEFQPEVRRPEVHYSVSGKKKKPEMSQNRVSVLDQSRLPVPIQNQFSAFPVRKIKMKPEVKPEKKNQKQVSSQI